MKRAVIPGTFDPITEGHSDIIRRASQIFDEIIVAVAESPTKGGKGPLFTQDERVELAQASLADLDNVEVRPFDNLLVDFAKEVGAHVVVKGLRAVTDFEYEFQMTAMNYTLDSSIETVFIMSPPQYMYLSSSVVREIAALGGDYSNFVSPAVSEALQAKLQD